jgi:hypothetical protein
MRAHIPGRLAAMALLLGGLACSHNKANVDEGSVVAQDSTKAKNDTSAYKGMERDTTAAPAPTPAPVDTTQAAPAPTPAPTPTDTSSYVPQKSPSDTGAAVQPTAPAPTPAPAPKDSSGWSKDTTKAQ